MDINELANKVVEAAQKCMGFPYVFGAWGEACTPANRKRRVRKEHPTIVSGCPVLSGKGTCENCKHNGQLIFDCRGFTYWCLK
jgi:cell wall-associated NlpC family hydrolase